MKVRFNIPSKPSKFQSGSRTTRNWFGLVWSRPSGLQNDKAGWLVGLLQVSLIDPVFNGLSQILV